MWNNAYLESQILTAEPTDLIALLYEAGLDAISMARRHLATGDVAARSAAITRALAIACELSRSLDHERGGAVSRNLAELYDYIQRLLIEANLKQADAPLREALNLLATIAEAWRAVQRAVAQASSGAIAEGPTAETDQAYDRGDPTSRFRHDLGITSPRRAWAV